MGCESGAERLVVRKKRENQKTIPPKQANHGQPRAERIDQDFFGVSETRAAAKHDLKQHGKQYEQNFQKDRQFQDKTRDNRKPLQRSRRESPENQKQLFPDNQGENPKRHGKQSEAQKRRTLQRLSRQHGTILFRRTQNHRAKRIWAAPLRPLPRHSRPRTARI